jgi:hypothetical protein
LKKLITTERLVDWLKVYDLGSNSSTLKKDGPGRSVENGLQDLKQRLIRRQFLSDI